MVSSDPGKNRTLSSSALTGWGKTRFGTYLGRAQVLPVPYTLYCFVIPNRFSGEESAFASFPAALLRKSLLCS